MKFVEQRPYANPEAAARKLMEIMFTRPISVGLYHNVGWINATFLAAGGSVAEYTSGRDYAVAQKWFEFDRSRTRVNLLQAGADLTA